MKFGRIKRVRTVELSNPPMTVTANGDQRSLDCPQLKAMGKNPSVVDIVVIKIGRKRSDDEELEV